MTNKALQELLDKQAITEVFLNYAHAVDHRDESRLRSVFHPASEHNRGFVGSSSDPRRTSSVAKPGDFVAFALNYLKGFANTTHQPSSC
jgi:hypothetical protein